MLQRQLSSKRLDVGAAPAGAEEASDHLEEGLQRGLGPERVGRKVGQARLGLGLQRRGQGR